MSKVIVESGVLWLSPEKYAFFMAHGKTGHDAKELYLHLQYTAILQKTNSVKANDVYLMKGLGWGNGRLKKAKAFLSKHGLLEYKQQRKKDGKLGESYLIVKTRQHPDPDNNSRDTKTEEESNDGPEQEPEAAESPPVLKDKCFNEKVKCLNEKVKEFAASPPAPPPDSSRRSFPAELYDQISDVFSAELERLGAEPYFSNIGRDRRELYRLFSQGVSVEQIIRSIPAFLSLGRDPDCRAQERDFWADKRKISMLVNYWGHDKLVAARKQGRASPPMSLEEALARDEKLRQKQPGALPAVNIEEALARNKKLRQKQPAELSREEKTKQEVWYLHDRENGKNYSKHYS